MLLRPATAPPLAYAHPVPTGPGDMLTGAYVDPPPHPGPGVTEALAARRPHSAPLRLGFRNRAVPYAVPSLPYPLSASTQPRGSAGGVWPPGPTLPRHRRRPHTAPTFSFRFSPGIPVLSDVRGPDSLPSPMPSPLPEPAALGNSGSLVRSSSVESSCGLSSVPEEEGLAVVGTTVMSRESLRLLQDTGGVPGQWGAREQWRLWAR